MSCRRRRVNAQREADLADFRQLRDSQADQAALPALRAAPVVTLSWYETGLEPVPQHQRAALRQHLMSLQGEFESLLASACEAPAGELDSSPAPAPASASASAQASKVDSLLAQVCATCTGYCCRHGNGRHAFLDAAALRKAWLEHSDLNFAELVDGYLDEIPALHHIDSCVFHGERGCVLSRNRRAELCNRWECPGLRDARTFAESSGATRFFVVRGKPGEAFAAGFVPSPGDCPTDPD